MESTDTHSAGSLAGKYLTLFLGDDEYGVDVLLVHEIIRPLPITPVPGTSENVSGVINLRGKIIPIIDTRAMFGLAPCVLTDDTCIVVVECGTTKGLLVDRVHEVRLIAGADIEPPPIFGESVDTAYIVAVGRVDGEVKQLLNIERLFFDTSAPRQVV